MLKKRCSLMIAGTWTWDRARTDCQQFRAGPEITDLRRLSKVRGQWRHALPFNSICAFILMVLSGWSTGAAAAAPDRFDSVRTYIRQQLVEQSIPSVAVAVVQDGRIIWEEGFGWANRERRIKADPHTTYSIASVTKPLTATALMTLVEAGKLELDKPANDYLGEAKLKARIGDARQATVRSIAGHTSGLPMHAQFFFADEPYRPPTRDETILRYGNLMTPPGEAYRYSNLGYGVLDYIIARTSGSTYEDYMRTKVFLPLGMTRTSVGIGAGLESYAAERYGPDGKPIPFYTFDHDGASAVYSSAHDLARFALLQLKARLPDQKSILGAASIDEMHKAVHLFNADRFYALGFFGDRQHGHRILYHGGGMDGVAAHLALMPDRRAAIIVLSNSSNDLPTRVSDRIAAIILPGWKTPDPASTTTLPPPPNRRHFVPPADLVGVWRGTLATYTSTLPVLLEVRTDGEIHAKFGDQMTALVDSPFIDDGVLFGSLLAKIGTPDTERADYVTRFSLRQRGPRLTGTAFAMATGPGRVRYALGHWLALEKTSEPLR